MQIAKTTMVMEGFVEEVAFELKPEGWEWAIHGRAEKEYSRQNSARATAWRLDIERNQHDWRVVGEGKAEYEQRLDQTRPNFQMETWLIPEEVFQMEHSYLSVR